MSKIHSCWVALAEQVAADERDGEVQDRDVHRDQQQRQRQDGERDPLLAAGRSGGRCRSSVVVVMHSY